MGDVVFDGYHCGAESLKGIYDEGVSPELVTRRQHKMTIDQLIFELSQYPQNLALNAYEVKDGKVVATISFTADDLFLAYYEDTQDDS